MNEILALIDAFANHINSGTVEECTELVGKLINLAETVYPVIRQEIADEEAKLDYNK